MKKWIKKVVAVSFVMAQFLVTPAVSASSLENIQKEKNAVEQEITQLQADVSTRLEEVSQITIALDELRQEIAQHKETITETEEDIEVQEVVVQERFEYAADQLQALQKNEVNQNMILGLLQAESLSELIGKVVAVTRLTGASEDRLIEAQEEQEKLDALQQELLVQKEALDGKETETVQQKEQLDTKVAQLQTDLAASETQLSELTAEEDQIRTEIAAAQKAAQEKAAREEAKTQAQAKDQPAEEKNAETQEASTVQTASSSASEQTKAPESKPTPEPKPQEKAAGSWMSFQSTGYSTQQAGLSTHTATGIDLRVNPRVIAVDPSVIPLNSLVEIEGLGVYIAGDTGGAINGRIIDIHYPSVGQALSWGRRNVNIRILN